MGPVHLVRRDRSLTKHLDRTATKQKTLPVKTGRVFCFVAERGAQAYGDTRDGLAVGFADLICGVLVKGDIIVGKHAVQFARQGHFGNDVAAANKFAFDV